jgi:iron complex transport system substrate-binding protein
VTRGGRAGLVVALLLFSVGPTAASDSPIPRRIISLVPAVTEILFAIGAGDRVIGVSSFDHYPPDVASRARVGALLDPDVERILSLRPDLVAIYGSQEDLRRQLGRAGIALFDYSHGGLADITTTIAAIGSRVGSRPEAERLARSIEARLDAIRRRVATRPQPRTLLVFGRDPLALRNIYASGGVGFLHDLLGVAGATNVFADVKRQSVQATTETILARAPEVIVELKYQRPMTDEEIAGERKTWRLLASVPAVRQDRVVLLVGDEFVVPGPRIADAAERLARAIHPEAFDPRTPARPD